MMQREASSLRGDGMSTAVRDGGPDLDSVLGVVQAERDRTEAGRRSTPKVVTALADAGLFRLQSPAVVGGAEMAPLGALEIFEVLAAVDATAAWAVWNNTTAPLLGRVLQPTATKDLFGPSEAIFAVSTRPSGRAIRADGGFCVRGRWELVSGCEFATTMMLSCLEFHDGGDEGREGAPVVRLAFVPASACEIIDTWNAGGLRGSGSHDVVVEDVWIESEHAPSISDPIQFPGPLFHLPVAAVLGSGCVSVALALAQVSVDTVVELAATKKSSGAHPTFAGRPHCQGTFAESEASLGAARHYLHHQVRKNWDVVNAGDEVDHGARALWFAAIWNAACAAVDTVRTMYELAGSPALYVGSPLERAHRDVHAIALHSVIGRTYAEAAGRVRFGLKADHPQFSA